VDVEAGSVLVFGSLIGVAKKFIPAGKLGALTISGFFRFGKGDVEFDACEVSYCNAASGRASKPADGLPVLGRVARAAALRDSSVLVRLHPDYVPLALLRTLLVTGDGAFIVTGSGARLRV